MQLEENNFLVFFTVIKFCHISALITYHASFMRTCNKHLGAADILTATSFDEVTDVIVWSPETNIHVYDCKIINYSNLATWIRAGKVFF